MPAHKGRATVPPLSTTSINFIPELKTVNLPSSRLAISLQPVTWKPYKSMCSVSYYIEPIIRTLKKKASEMEGARKVLRNILDFSVEDRLQNIKQAAPLKLRKLEQQHYVPAASDSAAEADPIPALGAGPVFPPSTPSSDGSPSAHAQKKRKRNNATD